MSGTTQEAETGRRLALRALGRAAALFIISVSMQACVIGGKKASLDTVLTTGSVTEPARVFPDKGLAADGRAILSALSSSPDETAGLSWENPESGARGLITAYSAREEESGDCLAFMTTRESFDGVGLYEGKACKDAAGVLRMRAFEQQ
ncbi:RT0821/Lpp0805 family surface protein [Chelativorans sp. AA-79]|uniref:RT0821/Lpp0805 family surface protein n=1 Tax=Chelativorans sp. AA-79 TaxID=3028735 RepID=UPI0023F889F7|nr:RT0821/Lpp0805 family surface protein [Chelativorans sp. AA-79]WEX07846.1 RT0821/Lpp0805 family surface protein [Chelativorans sp. AA-79]